MIVKSIQDDLLGGETVYYGRHLTLKGVEKKPMQVTRQEIQA